MVILQIFGTTRSAKHLVRILHQFTSNNFDKIQILISILCFVRSAFGPDGNSVIGKLFLKEFMEFWNLIMFLEKKLLWNENEEIPTFLQILKIHFMKISMIFFFSLQFCVQMHRITSLVLIQKVNAQQMFVRNFLS